MEKMLSPLNCQLALFTCGILKDDQSNHVNTLTKKNYPLNHI